MASVVLTVVGTAFGGPIGGMVGGMIGRSIDQAIFGGGSSRTIEGGRLKDLTVQTSAYGAPISRIYGTMRVPGNVVWSSGLKETRDETTQGGGKGGGQKVTSVTYRYSASFAVALSGREISDIGRIWADGKLLRDAAGKIAVGGLFRIYKGTRFQKADPLIEALEGAGNVNAFRNLSYVVFENLELGEYANRIPNLTFEVMADVGGTVRLSTIISDICKLSGVPSFDASGLGQMVGGYMIPGPMKSRSAIEDLSQIYHFDVVEQDNILLFRSLKRLANRAIISQELVQPSKGSDKVILTRQQDLDLPKEIGLSFIDPDRNYQAGHQRARRLNVSSNIVRQGAYPLVITANEAKSASEIQLDLLWYGRETVAFSLPHKYSDLMPGDIVTLPIGPVFQDFLLQETQIGLGGIACQAVKFSKSQLSRNSLADSGQVPVQIVENLASSQFYPLDMPTMTAENVTAPSLFWAASAGVGKWTGAGLFLSRDNGLTYQQIDFAGSAAITGVVENIISDGPSAYWDYGNEIIVRLDNVNHSLFGETPDAVLNGANIAWVGGEIIQFQQATLDMNGSYRLRGLLRGRRGSERFSGGHVLSENFVLLTGPAINFAGLNFSDIGKAHLYKAVTSGALVENSLPVSHVFGAAALKPFSPVHAKGVRDSANNITMTWIRRSRVSGDWMDNADVPLGELYEKYDIEILNGLTVVRTLTSAVPSVVYPATLQIEDFGALQPSLDVRITQMSDAVGRGWPLLASL